MQNIAMDMLNMNELLLEASTFPIGHLAPFSCIKCRVMCSEDSTLQNWYMQNLILLDVRKQHRCNIISSVILMRLYRSIEHV